MLETHVYEVLPGELLLRRSGHRSPLQQCKVIRTRAIAYPPTDEGVKVMITLVVTGYESCVFAKWFADWSDKDNMRARDLQSGRVIDSRCTHRGVQLHARDGSTLRLSCYHKHDDIWSAEAGSRVLLA